nr:uncharacterized protein LOC113689195 [Coffea arabica]
MGCGEDDDTGVQEELKKLAINDHDSASPEIVSKNADTQDSPTGEVNDSDATIPNDLPRISKFVQSHPRELIIGDPSEKARDEDIEIVDPSTKAPKKKIVTRGGKVKQTAQKKLVSPTAEPTDEQMEEQNPEENTIGGNEEPERAIQGDETNEGNTAENQQTLEPSTRKFPRTRSETQNVEASATQISKEKRSGKTPETVAESRRKNFHETPVTPRTTRDQSDYVSPFTIHPRKSASKSFSSNSEVISLLENLKQHIMLIEDCLMMTMSPAQQSSFIEKRNLLVPLEPKNNENTYQKELRSEPIGPTTGTEATPTFSSQPKDKGKAPATEEAYEEDDEETEEEVDPE